MRKGGGCASGARGLALYLSLFAKTMPNVNAAHPLLDRQPDPRYFGWPSRGRTVSSLPSLTATHFYLYAHCEHRVRLDLFGDPAARIADSDADRALKARGLLHEASIADATGYPRPAHGADNLERAFAETLTLMNEAQEGIYQGVLLADDLVGVPDLLVRLPGDSRLGSHHYTVGDVKLSRRARSDQALQVAFYAHLLETIQGVKPDRVFLVLGNQSKEWIPIEDLGGVFEQALVDLESLRRQERQTEPFFKTDCDGCPWRGVCVPALEASDDLSLLPGMTPSRRNALRGADVRSIEALAGAKPEALATEAGLETRTLIPLKRQAKALKQGKPIRLGASKPPEGPPALLVTAFDNPEGDGHTFLLTISFVDPAEEPRTAILWAENFADEKALYEKVLVAFARRPHAPVYHFGRAAPWQIARMEGRYGTGGAGLHALHRMGDMALLVRRGAALPVRRYGLGDCAGATGYKGAQPEREIFPLIWRLLEGEEEARDALLRAAQAEREATLHLLRWLRGAE